MARETKRDSGFGSNDDCTPESKRMRMDNDGQEIFDLDNDQYLKRFLRNNIIESDNYADEEEEDGDSMQVDDVERHQRTNFSDDNYSNDDGEEEDDEIKYGGKHEKLAYECSFSTKFYDNSNCRSTDDDGGGDDDDNKDGDDYEDDGNVGLKDAVKYQKPAQEVSFRHSKKVFSVTFKDKIKHNCETSGREAIKDMLARHVKKHFSLKMNTEGILFKRASDGCAINLGVLTADLEEEHEYICTFHNKEADYCKMRSFNITNYNKSSNRGCFYIKLERGRRSQPDVGGIKTVAEMIRIDYLPNETLFEAIVRDERLKVKDEEILVARKWYLKSDGKETFLDNAAHSYRNQCFKLYQKRNALPNLPTPPLPEPAECNQEAVRVEAKESLNSTPMKPCTSFQNNGNQEMEAPKNAASPSTIIIQICSYDDLEKYIRKTYDFDISKEENKREEKKRCAKIEKLYKTNEFALNYKSQILIKDLGPLSKLSGSVGAVVVELYGIGAEKFMGTCFVIGSTFIITNRHVLDKAKDVFGFKDFYVDFDFGNHGHKYRFSKTPIVSSSQDGELDYAILKLRDSCEKKLPASLSKCDFVIPWHDGSMDTGMSLTLVGHPGGSKKALDMTCPIKYPANLSKNTVISLARKNPHDFRVLHDKRRQTYDTSFSYGSSGSPGVLLSHRLLVSLHCRGFHLVDEADSVIQQGIKMSAILADVNYKIEKGVLPGISLKDIFDYDYQLENIEVESLQ